VFGHRDLRSGWLAIRIFDHASKFQKVPSLIAIDCANSPVDLAVLSKPGGFAWWYAELMDDEGCGAVVIWSFGLPFLPGYKSEYDQGHETVPRARPSLNVALYEQGKQTFYLLHEFLENDVSWDGANAWTFGDSTMRVEELKDRRSLSMTLDCPVAQSSQRLRGQLTLEGAIPTIDASSRELAAHAHAASTSHKWTPLALPAEGRFHFDTGDYTLSVNGHAYFDRNFSDTPLHKLGIDTWVWGHSSGSEGDRIFYILWEKDAAEPLCLGFELTRSGEMTVIRDLEPRLLEAQRTAWGMPTWSTVELRKNGAVWIRCELGTRIEHGPFYLRYISNNTLSDGEKCLGSAEIIVPDRIDLARHRPLVRMRVSQDGSRNSMWLALFEGTGRTRLTRLFKKHTERLRRKP
jgi:carotenoid 1,2-hydratase